MEHFISVKIWIQNKVVTYDIHLIFVWFIGRSLTIPCHYEPQYASYVKYCMALMIYDDPVQLVFSITMTQLKEEDSGWYMCGVEIGEKVLNTSYRVRVSVLSAGMSVLHSRLIGEEGSSVTAECFYSEKYRESPKKWCRSGDWSSCLLTDSEGAYTDATVDIQDDRSGAFAVTYKRLQMRHTGWYWCGAGQQKVAVLTIFCLKWHWLSCLCS
uniref:Immunoglobulin domain-containing protein n=1 Tax=Periophthalmus magnuspinnatus TaxID=409849 RepID=A0A3B4B9N3_9GOBI